MTIGIDCRLYSPKYTGIGRYVYEFVNNLSKLDKKNRYILYFNKEEYDSFKLPNERWQKKLVNIPHYSIAEQWKFNKILQKENIDLMYFPHFNAPFLYKKPFVVTIHDLTLHYYPYKSYAPKWSLKKAIQIRIYKFLMGKVVNNAKKIIAVSKNTKKDLLKEYKISRNKISTIYEGVPESFQMPSIKQMSKTKDKYAISKPFLLYTGVWRSHKNLLNLIRAFKILVDKGQDIQLVFTGKKDKSYPEIPALIKELDLNDRVVLTGFVSDEELINLIAGAEIYVFPSLYEGFGLPPLEAMQLNTPVACSNISSLPEICDDAALYFNPESVKEISDALERLLKDSHLRQALVKKGKNNLLRFSWMRMSKQILDIFNVLC